MEKENKKRNNDKWTSKQAHEDMVLTRIWSWLAWFKANYGHVKETVAGMFNEAFHEQEKITSGILKVCQKGCVGTMKIQLVGIS